MGSITIHLCNQGTFFLGAWARIHARPEELKVPVYKLPNHGLSSVGYDNSMIVHTTTGTWSNRQKNLPRPVPHETEKVDRLHVISL